jgi:DNA-binding IclR family transcriptional regulator
MRPTAARQRLTSADKALGVLSLFSAERPLLSPERAARRMGVSLATSYRYFNTLVGAGLLERMQRNRYVLGPAIVELDRQIRAADPVLKLAQPVMVRLLRHVREPAAVLLCRYYRQKVMCMHEETNRAGEPVSSYARGARRPMFRGATSKAILAFLPPRILAGLWDAHRRDICAAGLGPRFEDFKAAMRAVRHGGACISVSEVDPGRTGIAAPIFDANSRVVGSLSIVLHSARADARKLARLREAVIAAAREIERSRDGAPARKRAGRRRTR